MAELELATAVARELKRRIGAFVVEAGYGQPGAIPPEMSFRQWCTDLAAKGLKVDGHPFTLDDRPTLIPIYDAIPATVEDARRRTLVVMKGAQMGLTIWEMLADLYMALKFEPLVIGMFVPDQALAADKSDRRFLRLVRTMPEVHQKLIHRKEGDRLLRIGEGNVLTRIMGESAFLFLWTSGKVTTESRPMDVISYDEMQEMTLDQIDKTAERMSASRFRFRLMLSTANFPESDIHFWFKQGTQHTWHTECPHCQVEADLSEHFPGCIDYNNGQHQGAPLNEYVYVCPGCRGRIEDTQRGRFIAANPDASIESYHISQIISPTITPRDLIEQWNRSVTGDQKKTFYNRKLGKPFIDANQLPVSMTDCLACVEDGARAGVVWERSGRDCFMGIDQMGGYNAVIIKKRLPDGRQAVVHVEAVFDLDPFARCAELMGQFGVAICVCEQLPNVNDARRFANNFPGRVFLAGYADLRDDMLVWGDELTRSDRRTATEDRSRYAVTLHQYKMMQTALFRVRNRHCLFPDPSLLEQDVIDRGQTKRIAILRDWVFLHLTKTALVVEEDEATRKMRPKVMKVGLDPHFSFANMLCDVAWARSHGTSSFILPGAGPMADAKVAQAEAAAKAMPGLPRHVVAMMTDTPAGTCGRCSAFKDGLCEMRSLMVGAADPGCVLFDPRAA